MAGEVGDLRGLDFEHLVDLVGDVGEPALAAFEALLGARGLLARRAHGLQRGARGAVGFGERVLAGGQLIGRRAAGGFGGLDLADQREPLLFEHARGVFETRRARSWPLRRGRPGS